MLLAHPFPGPCATNNSLLKPSLSGASQTFWKLTSGNGATAVNRAHDNHPTDTDMAWSLGTSSSWTVNWDFGNDPRSTLAATKQAYPPPDTHVTENDGGEDRHPPTTRLHVPPRAPGPAGRSQVAGFPDEARASGRHPDGAMRAPPSLVAPAGRGSSPSLVAASRIRARIGGGSFLICLAAALVNSTV